MRDAGVTSRGYNYSHSSFHIAETIVMSCSLLYSTRSQYLTQSGRVDAKMCTDFLAFHCLICVLLPRRPQKSSSSRRLNNSTFTSFSFCLENFLFSFSSLSFPLSSYFFPLLSIYSTFFSTRFSLFFFFFFFSSFFSFFFKSSFPSFLSSHSSSYSLSCISSSSFSFFSSFSFSKPPKPKKK